MRSVFDFNAPADAFLPSLPIPNDDFEEIVEQLFPPKRLYYGKELYFLDVQKELFQTHKERFFVVKYFMELFFNIMELFFL